VPYLLTGTGPGELFLVRNVGAFVPPYDQAAGFPRHLGGDRVRGAEPAGARIVVCGHSHCGAIRALYGEVPAAAKNLAAGWSWAARRCCRWPSPAPRRCAAPSSAPWCCSWSG
jgi:carbonic anhydrase